MATEKKSLEERKVEAIEFLASASVVIGAIMFFDLVINFLTALAGY